jgi:hypothetical protein
MLALGWPDQQWLLITGSAVLAGLAATVASRLFAGRRGPLRKKLIEEAVTLMAAHADDPEPFVTRMFRNLVAQVTAQQDWAERIEREVRPRIPVGPARAGTAGHGPAAGAGDLVDELNAMIPALAGGEESSQAPRRAGGIGPVPMLDGSPDLADLYTALAETVATRVRQANSVIRFATQLEMIDREVAVRLADAISAVTEATRAGRVLADAGRLGAALFTLTQVDVPAPQEVLPGAATRPELDRQASRLHEILAAHRAELLAWCKDASARSVQARKTPRKTPVKSPLKKGTAV